MAYELILQFALAPRDVTRYDRVTQFEDSLAEGNELFALDGSDCRLGCIEVRLITEDPERALESVRDKIPSCCPYEVSSRLIVSS